MNRADLATEEQDATHKRSKPWTRRVQAALEELLMEWATEEPGKPPNPRTRRLEAALGYPLMIVGAIAFLWALFESDSSPALVAVCGMLSWAGGCLAWRGSYYRGQYEPPLELGLAREPQDDIHNEDS
ncbi:MAG: hypothetical protein OXC19_11940 [Bryobacterales bacterium]|nr:hypothetical protein [Bryobacterales bacterium]